MAARGEAPALAVRAITPEQHLGFINEQPSASFLQTPAWGRVKTEWRHESVGWYARSKLVGAGLVLYRQLPRLRRYLAYLPEGPVIDWAADDLGRWLDPMTAHLKARGAFGVRMGPPVVVRAWEAQQVKDGIADPAVRRLADLPPARTDAVGAGVVDTLSGLGWRPQRADDGGFAVGQPQFVFQVPLAGRTEGDVLAGMNQLWRRNIKKGEKSGVVVTATASPGEKEVGLFHDLYVHTAARDHFTPRPPSYFTTMLDALSAEDPGRVRLWFATHEEDLVAATVAIRVGTHAWYSYGASSTDKREVRGSNAAQWAMIRDALAGGCEVYDLRGITDTLDAEDSHVGLVQFKVGTGGEAVEYAGEWDLPLSGLVNKALYAAFDLYMRRRG